MRFVMNTTTKRLYYFPMSLRRHELASVGKISRWKESIHNLLSKLSSEFSGRLELGSLGS